jgi:1,4-alpha-glucan branching enzyme
MEVQHTASPQAARPTGRTGARGVKGTAKTGKRIEFVLRRPEAKIATLAGSFNNWDSQQTPMNRNADGVWKATIRLRPGRYEYRFVVDGQWLSDPNARESVPNQFGDTNSVLTV